jgi:hypothetical protein
LADPKLGGTLVDTVVTIHRSAELTVGGPERVRGSALGRAYAIEIASFCIGSSGDARASAHADRRTVADRSS